jgi:two-component system sensor histidine kinase DesK
MHAPFVAFTTVMAWTGMGFFPATNPLITLPLALTAGGLQVRHSLAAARGTKPSHWPWTLALVILIACAPSPWFADPPQWGTMQWFAIASTAMLLPRSVAVPVITALVIGLSLWNVEATTPAGGFSAVQLGFAFGYPAQVLLVGGIGLFAATRLVKTIDELSEARAEIAQLDMGAERLRISRDLHDLLGRTLSALSLKGDLAVRLLRMDDRVAAAAETESLAAVARSALRDMRDVAREHHAVSLATELDGAANLLRAAGVRITIESPPPDLPAHADDLFAWAVREGVTNLLRHSEATSSSIRFERDGGRLRLEIQNNGAAAIGAEGHGLRGLGARAAAIAGLTRTELRDGWFHLLVEVPEDRS